MPRIARLAGCTLLLASLLAAPAQAQDQPVEVDTQLICDTQAQVERFVALFEPDHGSVETAIAAVNAEHPGDEACVVATALYRRRAVVATVSNDQASFDVVRIEVLGVYTLKGFERAIPTDFFMPVARETDSGTVGKRP